MLRLTLLLTIWTAKKQNTSKLQLGLRRRPSPTRLRNLPTVQCVDSLVDEDVAFSTNMYTNRILSHTTPSVTGSVNKEHL